MQENLISVVIPVYKVEKYLRDCLDSVLSSTYKNLEIILVDDGSPDHCGDICDEYASRDERIVVIHQENRGLVGARNSGIEVATGEYISFVDSDDIISPLLYEVLLNLIQQESADIAGCEYSSKVEDLNQTNSNLFDIHRWTGKEEMLALITTAPSVRNASWTGPYVWNKLYRRRKIEILYRPECLMCEDLRYNYDYVQHCNKIATVHSVLYYYRTNQEGICGDYRNNFRNKLLHGIRNSELWKEIASSSVTDTSLESYLKARATYMSHGALWRICFSGKEKEYCEFVKNTRNMIGENYKDVWDDKQTYSVRVRLIIAVCRFAYPIWYLAAKILGKIDERK